MAPHGPRMVNDGRPAQATAVAGPRTRRGPRTHPSSYPHPHTHAPHRTAPHPHRDRDIDLRKSFQTEMISPPFHPRLFFYLLDRSSQAIIVSREFSIRNGDARSAFQQQIALKSLRVRTKMLCNASNVAVTRVRKQSHQAHFSGENASKLVYPDRKN